MDLERSLANIKIDETPWRTQQHDQQQQAWTPMPGGASNNQGWGHMSPQQMRNNPWPDPNSLAQNVNEALGIGAPGAQGAWGAPMGGPGDFGDPAKIWSDPNPHDQQFNPMHNHHRGMNGIMGDPSGGDGWMGVPSQSQQPMWSDPIKQEQDGYWKQQQHQQGGWNGPPGNMGGGVGFRMPPQHQRRGGNAPPMGMHMPMRVGPPGGWNNPMYPVARQQGPADHGGWNPRGGMARGMGGGGRGYPPQGVDMSVPPPIDMPGGMPQLGMRQMPPAGSLWKQEQMGGAPNGIRPNPYGQMPAPFGMPSKPQGPGGQFPIAGADDLMWHDPNGDLKKWQRDTGVSFWGDPEKCNERPIRNWIVAEGDDEDLEAALNKCPVPQKRNEDGTTRLPFSLPSKRSIVVTGWGELPENDPNNPVKPDVPEDMPSSSKWGDMTPLSSNEPWYLPGQQPAAFVPEGGAWGQPPAAGAGGGASMMQIQGPMGGGGNDTQHIADQLRYAVDKGYLDMSILSHQALPPAVLENMRALLSKIPQLESVDSEMGQLVESVRPEGEIDGSSPQRWMNEVQKVEYNRLIIEVTTAKIEVTDLSKKINAGLAEAGMESRPQDGGNGRGDGYHYSFLDS